MKKILVPIDFSEKSEFAINLAAKINEKTDCEIHVIHLVELPENVIDMIAGSINSIPERMLYLRKIRSRLLDYIKKSFPDDDTIRYSIRVKNPYQGIIDYSKKINADLIIMGSKGISDFDEIMIGSNTEKVVRTSVIPVLVVKTSITKFNFNTIVYASNFKEDNKQVFQKFLDF
jgi:nucleotide-binding universal stress UspA family protein